MPFCARSIETSDSIMEGHILKNEDILQGSKFLGFVEKTTDKFIFIKLPDFHYGVVAIDEYISIFHEKIKEDEISPKDLLHKIVSCMVNERTNEKRISLTLDPCKINDFDTTDVKKGDVIWGFVSSKEDNGYLIDFGLTAPGILITNQTFKLSTFDFFIVLKASNKIIEVDTLENLTLNNKGSKSTKINSKKLATKKLQKNNSAHVFNTDTLILTPGNLIKMKKFDVGNINRGVSFTFGAQNGFISPLHSLHLTNSNGLVVLYNTSKFVNFTGIDIFLNKVEQYFNNKIGDIIDVVPVEKLPYGTIFNLNDGSVAFGFRNDLEKHVVGEKCSVRVKNDLKINGCICVSNTKEIMSETCVLLSDCSVGMLYDCIVTNINTYGFDVRVSSFVNGFIFKHLAGGKQFNRGDKVRCRILDVNFEKNNLILTCSDSLINSTLEILDGYREYDNNQWFLGYVEKISKSFLIVKFYRNTSGLLHRSEMNIFTHSSLETLYQIGDIIKARVVHTDELHNRLSLSTKPINSSITILRLTNPSQISFPIKNLENCLTFDVISTDQSECIDLSVIVPDFHLSDFRENVSIFHKVFSNNTSITVDAVLMGRFFDNIPYSVCSLKSSFVKSVTTHAFPMSIHDITVGMCVNGYILSFNDLGVQVIVGLDIIGFIPSSNITIDFLIGSTIIVVIKEVDLEKHRVILSLYDDKNASISLNFSIFSPLLSYLKELSFLANKVFGKSFSFLSSKLKFKKDKNNEMSCVINGENISVELLSLKENKSKNKKSAHGYIVNWDNEIPLKLYAVIMSESQNTNLGKISVIILKNFPRFSVGVSIEENESRAILLCTNSNLYGKQNGYRLNSSISCNIAYRFHHFYIAVPNDGSILESNIPIQCTVTKINSNCLKVKTNTKQKAFIHISKINNKNFEGDRPLDRFSIGDTIDAFWFHSISKNSKYISKQFSKKNELTMQSISSTSASDRDFHNGHKYIGFVRHVSIRRLYIDLSSQVKGYVNIVDLKPVADFIHDPLKQFLPGTAIEVKVSEYDAKLMMYKLTKHNDVVLKVGDVVNGRIYRHDISKGICVDLPCFQRGIINITNISDNFSDYPFPNYPINSYIQCVILSIISPKLYNLSIKHMFSNDIKDIKVSNDMIGKVFPSYVIKTNRKNIRCILSDQVSCLVSLTDDNKTFLSIIHPLNVMNVKVISVLNNSFVSGVPVFDDDSERLLTDVNLNINSSIVQDKHSCLKIGSGFDWNTGTFIGVDDREIPERDLIPSDEDGIEVAPKKMKISEHEIRVVESKLASNKYSPTTPDDFERCIASSPNSSIVWISYMAYYLQSFELEKARKIGERALKSIYFREENELFNVWLAFINTECLYGSQETHEDIYRRCMDKCNKKRIYKHLINLYQTIGKIDSAEIECLSYIKLFSLSKKGYIMYGKLLASNNRFIEMKNILRRALQSLPERKHIQTIVQFTLLEFKYGDIQRASTLIEKVLTNFPKRLDIWFMYVDQLIKASAIQQARTCFEKMCNLTLKNIRKLSVYKKYINFEESQQNKKAVQIIQNKIDELKIN